MKNALDEYNQEYPKAGTMAGRKHKQPEELPTNKRTERPMIA